MYQILRNTRKLQDIAGQVVSIISVWLSLYYKERRMSNAI